MLKSEMQHQYWITKKAVQRKLGSKEDEHVTSSDAELDAKVEIFRSITKTSLELAKVVDQYQDRLFILSQEEALFGRFLKDYGSRSKTTGKIISNTGKGFSFCGQQRMCVRLPLLRLQNEVNVFRARAISDMQQTLTSMERERTVYRAALSWIKSVSIELDPDTGKGLDKFRAAQSHVRMAKQNFDTLSMDSIQKIDLLAAARCNMFSHVLMSYLMEFRQFSEKTAETLNAISQVLIQNPKYDFNILKDLTNHEIQKICATPLKENEKLALDLDQSIFLTDDYTDTVPNTKTSDEKEKAKEESSNDNKSPLIKLEAISTENIFNISLNCATNSTNCNEMLLQPFPKIQTSSDLEIFPSTNALHNEKIVSQNQTNNSNSWIELFAELDPLTNLDAFDMKFCGDRKNFQQT